MSPTLFAKNLIRLFKFDLKSFHKTIRRYADLDLMMDNLKYEIADEIRDMKLPKVLSQMDSVKEIIKTKKSVARFGDGEFNLILGNAIGFQSHNFGGGAADINTQDYIHGDFLSRCAGKDFDSARR